MNASQIDGIYGPIAVKTPTIIFLSPSKIGDKTDSTIGLSASATPCIIELTNPTTDSINEPMLEDKPLISDTKKLVRLSKNSGARAAKPSNNSMINVTNESII